MRTQIRLRRAQEKRFQRTMEPQEANLIPENEPNPINNNSYTVSINRFCQN